MCRYCQDTFRPRGNCWLPKPGKQNDSYSYSSPKVFLFFNHTARCIAPVCCKPRRTPSGRSGVAWIWCISELSKWRKLLATGVILFSSYIMYQWFVNVQDGYCDSALIIACQYGYSDIARALLDQGAMIDYQNQVRLIIILLYNICFILYVIIGWGNCFVLCMSEKSCRDCEIVVGVWS